MFATGIENSSPTIQHGRVRVDEMESCGHYKHWRIDFDKVEELGIHFLRYGVPLQRVYLAPQKFDWDFSDIVFGELRRRRIICIADLCHFGVPEWVGNFQNPEFPELFARYAGEFARRFPWIQFVYAGERDVRLRVILGPVWLVERAAYRSAFVRDSPQAHC